MRQLSGQKKEGGEGGEDETEPRHCSSIKLESHLVMTTEMRPDHRYNMEAC